MTKKKKQYNLLSWKNETVKIQLQLQEDSFTSEARAASQEKCQLSVHSSDESITSDHLSYYSDTEADRLHNEMCNVDMENNTAQELISK